MLVIAPSRTADFLSAPGSLHGLDWVNFFLAGALAGFGPYVAVYLADQKWTQEQVGFVLSASAAAGLLSQAPGGSYWMQYARSGRFWRWVFSWWFSVP
jgi:hypothetical protein